MTGRTSLSVFNRFVLILAGMSIASGGLIYLGARPLSLNLFRWCGLDESNSWLLRLRNWFDGRLPEWIVYEMPGGLWSLSYVLLIGLIWKFNLRQCLIMGSIIPSAGVLSELLQSIGVLPGHFDMIDLGMYVAGWLIGVTIIGLCNYSISKRYEEKI